MQAADQIRKYLGFLYGEQQAKAIWLKLIPIFDQFQNRNPHLLENSLEYNARITERDIIFITYGDQFQSKQNSHFQTLHLFMREYLGDAFNSVHILPFYPYSSDDGFSVIDYYQTDPQLGNWRDINKLGSDYELMFDAVINHISRQSMWFQEYIQGSQPYEKYFIEVSPEEDLSLVVRPRALPLLTSVETSSGEKYVWTTFSDDQIDLDYSNPGVFIDIVELLLFYVSQGARIIRLDAIAYLRKKIGTPCIHLPQTHIIVKLFRSIFDMLAPDVLIITETNVPHEDNISYFGTEDPEAGKTDEAQLVYQFPLAPLILHTFRVGNTNHITKWVRSLDIPGYFFNFIASHDGIGVMPAEDLLNECEVQGLVDMVIAHGGHVSYKTNTDGTQSVYELNTTLFDALNDPASPDAEQDIERFIASQAIMLSLAGVPGVYVHSLFGSRNFNDYVTETGRVRSINRGKFEYNEIIQLLDDPSSLTARIFYRYLELLRIRRMHKAFHPAGEQHAYTLSPKVFALHRFSLDKSEEILCLTNVTANIQNVSIPVKEIGMASTDAWRDLIKGQSYSLQEDKFELTLNGFQTLWFWKRNT